MRDFRKVHLSTGQRAMMRPVALAYRRIGRALRRGGWDTRDAEPYALDAASAEFRKRRPEAVVMTRHEVSSVVNPILAAAINTDTEWFWRGSDA